MKKMTMLIIFLFCLYMFSGCNASGLQYFLHENGEYYVASGNPKNEKKYVVIPDEYKEKPIGEIAANAFSGWKKLDSVTISGTVGKIGENAFSHCSNLQNLFFEKSDENKEVFLEIEKYAFADCDSLTKLFLPKRLKALGEGVFFDCDNIYDIYLSENLETIGKDAFRDCDSLMSITVEGQNKNFKSENGVLFNADGSILLQYPQAKGEESFSIGYDLKEIGEKAFMNADIKIIDLNNLIIDKLGDYAFQDCKSLQKVVLCMATNEIGVGCFSGCSNLQEVVFYETQGWTAIQKDTFGNVTDKREFSTQELSDPVTAKTMLTQYCDYQWIRR